MLSPLVVVYTLWRAHKDGGKAYLLERLGVYPPPDTRTEKNTEVIWIHAASVGEVFTVLPLLKAINTNLLITTTTPTGAGVLAQQKLTHVQHCYLPVDFAGACKRFFKHHAVREGWVVETEIWPWLYACAHNNGTNLSIISGRLSPKTSSQAHGFLASTFRRALTDVRVLARSDEDASRFATLGALPAMISVAGNLKYANPAAGVDKTNVAAVIDRPYVLAASTHGNEEQRVAEAWCLQAMETETEAKAKANAEIGTEGKGKGKGKGKRNGKAEVEAEAEAEYNALLVIVPRHAERGDVIQKQLAEVGILAPLRSKSELIQKNSRVYIADTMGELQAWYTHAIACFVGGSLVERGGHNILEPARLGCPVVVGPYTENFADIIETFSNNDALVVAAHVSQVVQFLHGAIDNPKSLEAMAQRAQQQARQSEEVLSVYLEALMGQPETSSAAVSSVQ